MIEVATEPRRSISTGPSSVVDLRTVIRRKDAEIAELKSALDAAERETAEWQRKWHIAYTTSEACPAFDDIVDAVCAEYRVAKIDVLSDRRAAKLARPRHVAMYLCSQKTKRSFPIIGKYFRRDHSTIMQNCRRLAAKMENDATLAARVNRLSASLDRA